MLRPSLAFLLLLLISCSTPVSKLPPCIERRSVIEMGTNRIKLTIADVDVCKKKFIKTVGRKDWAVEQDSSIYQDFEGTRSLSHEVNDKTIKVFEEAKKIIATYSEASSPLVIATGVFREVKGSEHVFDKIKNIIGSRPNVISALKETRLGEKSLQATEAQLPTQYLVWDIGGNSMQFTLKQNTKSQYFLGGMGSQFYKQLAKTILKRKDSPNPIEQKNLPLLKAEFLKVGSSNISKLSGKVENISVYGIGAVHSESILKRLQDFNESIIDLYTINDLRQLTVDTVNLTDGQLGGSYSPNQVTNQIIVEAIMDYLKIKQINVRTLDLTQGALVYGLKK